MAPASTDTPFTQALAQLLAQREMSQRALAQMAGVNQSHLSRLLRQADYHVRPSTDLMARLSTALGLPEDYFREAREQAVIDRVKSDSAFREKAYAQLRRAGST